MPSPRVAILTSEQFPALYAEEQALPSLLAARGVDAEVVVWSDPQADLAKFDIAVFRSIWDYFERMGEFLPWLERVAAGATPFANATSLVRWNLDKAYLLELAARGVDVVATRHFKDGDALRLGDVMDNAGWSRVVMKPAISGGAYRTHLVDRADAARFDDELNALRTAGGVLVQPYLDEVARGGEHSLIYLDGVFSHAVVKLPKANDFRVQLTHGGTFVRSTPTPEMLTSAEAVLAALPEAPLYARVDGLVLADGKLHLMEVELIEPYLYFEAAPEAVHAYVAAIARAAQSAKSSSSD